MGFKITNASGATDIQCFVSNYTNDKGSDSWFSISTASDTWSRGPGWELVAFKDSAGHQRGWYLNVGAGETCKIKFYGFDRDIGLSYE